MIQDWVNDYWNNEKVEKRLGFVMNIVDDDMELAKDLASMDAKYMKREYPDYYSMVMGEVEDFYKTH